MNLLDNSGIDIPCPHCGKKTKKRIGSVKNHKTFTCPGCGKSSTLDTTGLRKGLGTAQDSLAKLQRAIDKFGK